MIEIAGIVGAIIDASGVSLIEHVCQLLFLLALLGQPFFKLLDFG
jgi:hypothetical protein